MSGLEVLGAVGSVVGVVGAVKTCIDLLEIISTARSTSRDVHELSTHLQWQYLQFASWVMASGFGDVILQQSSQGDQLPEQALSHLPRQFQSGLFLSLLTNTIQNMKTSLMEAHAIIQRYEGVTLAPAQTQCKDWGDRIKRLKFQLHLGSTDTIAGQSAIVPVPEPTPVSDDLRSKTIGLRQKVRWVALDSKQLKDLFENVCLYNKDLALALPDSLVRSFERRVETNVTTSEPIASCPQAIQLLQTALRNCGLHTTAIEGPGTRPPNTIGAAHGAPGSLTLGTINIRLSDIGHFSHSGPSKTSLVKHREFILFRSLPAVVEWRYYSTRSSIQTRSYLDSRVHMLVLQLQQLSTLPRAHMLQCLGYVHDEKNYRHGLVYAYPEGPLQLPPSHSTPMSLRERLHRDYAKGMRGGQDTRFAYALSLVLSAYRLLSVRWLHKNLTAESVLLFENDGGLQLSTPADLDGSRDTKGLSNAFLCGFTFSRRDAQLEISERLASAYLQQPRSGSSTSKHQVSPPGENEHMLYWHPDRCLSHGHSGGQDILASNTQVAGGLDHNPQSYQIYFDVYSLGVLLLEIGLWCPIERIAHKAGKKDPESFTALLRTDYDKSLRNKMGSAYANIVSYCLKADFGRRKIKRSEDPGIPTSKSDPSTEEEEYLGGVRSFLEEFETKVVSKMERLCSDHEC